MDPAKVYLFELTFALGGEENPSATINSINATYTKTVFTSGAIKSATYNHYASPATFGLPDQVHLEYGSGGGAHSTKFEAADNCIVTRYEYNAAVDPGGENYANLFPSKIIQDFRDADQTAGQQITEVRYNQFGDITQIQKHGASSSSEVLTNTYTYDGLRRLTSEVYRSNRIENEYLKKTYLYSKTPDANGLFYTEIRHQDEAGTGDNHVTQFYYDRLGQYVKTTKGVSSPITIEKVAYDAFGRKALVEDGEGVKTAFQYDGYGREKKISSIDKTGVEKAYKENIYDNYAQTITENFYDLTDPTKTLKGKLIKRYNGYGQLLQAEEYPWANESAYYRTKYSYDLQNQVVSTLDPRVVALKYEYDYFGIKRVDYPGSLRADDVYIYNYLDGTKQVKKELAANSYIVTEYDELDRVKCMTYPEARTVKNYYDEVGRLLKTTETSVIQSVTRTTEIAYEYDLTGNVKKAKHTYNGNVYEVSYSYDEKGNVTGITYPGGYSVGYEYDAYGRVINVPQFVQGGGSTPGVKYKANGFVEEIRYVNGITTAFTDDSLGRIQRINNPVFNLTYGYDGKGNITSITGSNGTAVASTYSYSDNGWLKEARQGQNVYSYIYDNAGNCTTKTINGVQTSYEYASNELNLLTLVNGNGVTYDKMGNMTGRIDIGCSYTYDQSNRLTEVMKNGQDVGRYYYNSEGKRYQKVENGESTYYVYSGESLLYELKPDGAKVYYIYLNGKQIAKVEGGQKYFYHTDHLGSTRAITNEQGGVVGRFEYQPFGAEESTVTGDDTLTFTGKMQDDPTGLMYFNARYYDPTLGRFLSEDSAKDGVNWYAYCNNNPLRYVDPSGNIPLDTVIDIISIGVDVVRILRGDMSALRDLPLDILSAVIPYLPSGAVKGAKTLLTKGEKIVGAKNDLRNVKLLSNVKIHRHHIFPQSMRKWFAGKGIDIDKFTVELTEGIHLKGVHGKGGFVGPGDTVLQGKWNKAWEAFIKEHPDATSKQIYQFAGKLMDEFGLSGLEIIPYK